MRNNVSEKRILTLLRISGYRITKPRREIIRAVLKKSGLFSAKSLSRVLTNIELSTIYRTLSEFVELGVFREVHVGSGTVSYELAHMHHDHLVCLKCGKVAHVDCSRPEIPTGMGKHFAKIVSHEITWSGVCASCA